MSHASSSSNAADLLSRFRQQQAQHDEHRVEVGATFGACFVYHPKGCEQCSTYVEHLLADISERPSKYSFEKEEILNNLHEAWPHIKKADTHQLRSELSDLQEKIQLLEAQVQSLQSNLSTGDQNTVATMTTDISSSDVDMHPLASPSDGKYSRKHSHKAYESNGFLNYMQVHDTRPTHWSLYMWNTLKEWYVNPMSIPNALRDDRDGYFFEEDVDVMAWMNKISADIYRPAFNIQMKAVFGSRDKFDTAFSGLSLSLLRADHESSMWITDLSTPLRIGDNITKGKPRKPQNNTEDFPKGPDFLLLVLKHCALSRAQIYQCIIPYMMRQEEKKPCSDVGAEHKAHMRLTLKQPAPNKGKRPMAGSLRSRISAHAPTPAKTGESSKKQLDAELDLFQQVRGAVLPYEEAPPSGEPETGGNSILPEENTMDIDQEIDDIYD
ncbi:hypothetical protein M422DRAFT_240346 [Sphaerobolus stellatus SS14]|nr:hypothetical protein M422DRAFT_240346 [Sphaerobolus stellatus SS14]